MTSNTTRILFVCLGNICRSAAANGIMQQMVEQQGLGDSIMIDSAGTYGGHAGDLPDPRMRVAASRRGYNLTHRARKVREQDFYDFDLIVVMDDTNYENVARLAPERKYLNKVYRFVEFSKSYPEWSYVPDPYYEGHEGFELVLDLLEDGCSELLNQINKGLI
ncbi:MAG: low molecular weight phosphotyrosine protein phosphatase [Alistipes sp.]|nr:low molecular weight phosphotyrosine protein phosphatase [Alistipes sp.]